MTHTSCPTPISFESIRTLIKTYQAEKQEERRAEIAKVEEEIANIKIKNDKIYIDANGNTYSQYRDDRVLREIQQKPTSATVYCNLSLVDDDTCARYNAAFDNRAWNRAQIESILPDVRAELKLREEERAREEARLERERSEIYKRLPVKLQERHQAGFASEQQIQNAMIALLCKEAGLRMRMSGRTRFRPKTLSARRFETLKLARAQHPDKEVNPIYWHVTREDEQPNRREIKVHALEISWTVADLEINATITYSSVVRSQK